MKDDNPQTLTPRLRFPEFRVAPGWNTVNGNELFDLIDRRPAAAGLPILAVTQEHGAIARDQIDYHVSVTETSIASYKEVQPADFIISLRSFQGGIEYSRVHGICSPAYVVLKRTGNGEDHFYRHLFKSERFIQQLTRNIEGLRDGKMISYKQFSEQLLPIPSPAEQRKIAGCLGSLDELIAAEGRKLEGLRAHKKGLMQHLFPRDSETRPRLRFPEFRERGEWETKCLAEVAAQGFTNGIFNNTKREPSPYRLINVLEMYLPHSIDENKLAYARATYDEIKKKTVCHGDIFFTRSSLVREGIAYSNIYLGSDSTVTFDGHLIQLRPATQIVYPLFLHFALKSSNVRSQLVSKSKTATMTTIGQDDVAETTLSVPPLAEQQRIAACLSSLDAVLAGQSQKLAALRTHKQALMQQLFPSGEGDRRRCGK